MLALTEEQAHYTDPRLRQLAWWLAVLAFFAAYGHLLIVDALMQSLSHAPVAALAPAAGARQLIEGAGWIRSRYPTGFAAAVFALLLHLSLAIIARTQPGVDMFSTGLALGALGILVAQAWAVPLIAVGIQQGLVKMQPWLTLGIGR